VLAWPEVEIGIMGARPAVEIVHRRDLAENHDPQAVEALVSNYAERYLRPSFAASCGVVDEIVEPMDTRTYLRSALSVLRPETRRPREDPLLLERVP
jgi:acetyl-CoA carboxylase carboxyltransferase component